MNKLGTSLRNNKNLLKSLLLFILISFLISLLLFNKVDSTNLINSIKNMEQYLSNQNINYVITHFITISILLTGSLTIIGVVLIPLYFLYEFVCINYSIFILLKAFQFSGFIYGLIYNILTKGIYLILLLLLSKKIINIIKTFKISEEKAKIYSINKNIKCILLIIISVIVNDIIIYFFASKILLKLLFIIS